MKGKLVSRTEGNIDDSLIVGNASIEGLKDTSIKNTVITDVDVVMNCHLQETNFTKKSLQKVHQRLHEFEQRENLETRENKTFIIGAAEQINHILVNFTNYQFFIGANMNPNGLVLWWTAIRMA